MLVAAIATSWAANNGTGAPVTCSPAELELLELLPLLPLLPLLLEDISESDSVLSMGRFSALLGDFISSAENKMQFIASITKIYETC